MFFEKVKNWLKCFFPLPIRTFWKGVSGLQTELLTHQEMLRKELTDNQAELRKKLTDNQAELQRQLASWQAAVQNSISKELKTLTLAMTEESRKQIETAHRRSDQLLTTLQQKIECCESSLQEQRQKLAAFENRFDAYAKACDCKQEALSHQMKKLDKYEETSAELRQLLSGSGENIRDIQQHLQIVRSDLRYNSQYSLDSRRSADEAVWASIFHDTIVNSSWLTNRSFAPGRWAIGYSYLYMLYQALEKARPKRILDLGLGISSKIIAQYAAENPEVEHLVVETNPSWIEYYKREFTLPPNTQLILLEENDVQLEGAATRMYRDFARVTGGRKFDLISVDAPVTQNCTKYARIDILDSVPECLEESFVLLFDDYQFTPIMNTVEQVKKKLTDRNVEFNSSVYRAKKDMAIIASKSWEYLVSL